jgi:hypothetical protein
MGKPADLGTIDVVAGDWCNIQLLLQGMDRSSSTFRAHVRKRAADPPLDKLAEFTASVRLQGSDTSILLQLTGDSAAGQADGETRKLGRSAVFDVEEDPLIGQIRTIASGKINVIQDVTR